MLNSFRCQRCTTLPQLSSKPGWLHLYFPIHHSLEKVLYLIEQEGRQFSRKNSLVSVYLASEDLNLFLAPLHTLLTPSEKEDTKALFQPHDQEMQLEDYFAMESLQRFMAKCQSIWLIQLIEKKQLYSVFQPIVCAKESMQVFAYECLMRAMHDEMVIPPGQLFAMARDAGLIFQLDVASRFAAIQGAVQHQIAEKVFVNFTPSAIYDPIHCLRSTVRELDILGLERNQVVFEVIESEHVGDVEHLRTILNYYRREGFQVALDDLGSGYSSLNMLHELRPDYVKLDMGLVRNVDQDQYKGLIAGKLLETAQLLEVKTIAEGVETEGEYLWLKDHGADYLQGYYFAQPASPPPRSQVWNRACC